MWQSLLRNWLLNAAKQQMSASGSASPHPESAPASEPAGPPAPPPVCHFGLVFALGIEAGSLVDRLSGRLETHGEGFLIREGVIGDRRVVLVEAGATAPQAARGTAALIGGHHPRWLISAGFAGGLDSRLKKGDILMADEIVDVSGRTLRLDVRIGPAQLAATPGVHVGRLLSVERIINDAKEKQQLGAAHQALACDLETMAVAEVCRQEKVRCLSVRVISDAVDEQLSPELDLLIRKKTTAGRLGAATRAIFRQPSNVKHMWQLKEDALVASERLATFLVSMFKQLD